MGAHRPVLLPATLQLLDLQPGDVAVDATSGAGGHTEAIAAAVGASGTVIALDRDETALQQTRERLGHLRQLRFVRTDFRRLADVLRSLAIEQVDAICADLGLGSFQLDDPARGFSFRSEALLDMRMDRSQGRLAHQLLATLPEAELGRILRDFGEEPRWRAIARAIVRHRQAGGEFTGAALRELVHGVAGSHRRHIDAATLTFQAIRIAVNGELDALREFLAAATDALRAGGRIAVIAYHSLEDRIVKDRFRAEEKGCICPSDLPRCGCGHTPRLRVLTRKPIVPEAAEIRGNPRARSAKLRAAEKRRPDD
jgi:16S rRNA (cytosine1402-N4)-methyltransferase